MGTRNLSIFVLSTFGFSRSFHTAEVHLEICFALTVMLYNLNATSVAIISGEVHASSRLGSVQELNFFSKKYLCIHFFCHFDVLNYFRVHHFELTDILCIWCMVIIHTVNESCMNCRYMDIKWCRVLDFFVMDNVSADAIRSCRSEELELPIWCRLPIALCRGLMMIVCRLQDPN